ncbi:MAG: VOC family protein [Fimbriimonas sp.]
MPRVIHFEICADQPERAIGFYSKVFGWSFNKWQAEGMEYWMVGTGEGVGIDGGLFKPLGPMTGHVNTVDVPDIDEYIQKVKDAGGEIVVDKMLIPGIGWHAYAKDTEGSLIGMMQMLPRE